jgi:hypothetical protein
MVSACALIVGCSDSSVSPDVAAGGTTDPYVVYSVEKNTLNSFSEVPSSLDDLLNDPMLLTPDSSRHGGGGDHGRDSLHRGDDHGRDSLHHGGDTLHHGDDSLHHGDDSLHHGRGPDTTRLGGDNGRGPDTLHHGGDGGRGPDTNRLGGHRGRGPEPTLRGGNNGRGDTVRHHDLADTSGGARPVNFGQIVSQLGLSAEQDSLIRLCFAAQRECHQSAETSYKSARRALFDSFQVTLRGIRVAVAGGQITRDEGSARIKAANEAYRTSALALEASYRQADDACWQDLDGCVRSHLTPEQIAKWALLAKR